MVLLLCSVLHAVLPSDCLLQWEASSVSPSCGACTGYGCVSKALLVLWPSAELYLKSLCTLSVIFTVIHNLQLFPVLSKCSEIFFLLATPPPQFTAYLHPYPSLFCTSLILAEPQPPPVIPFFILYYSIRIDPSDFIKLSYTHTHLPLTSLPVPTFSHPNPQHCTPINLLQLAKKHTHSNPFT